ncbi:Alpha-factor-transporting ATPase, partial [Lacticaseibacillus paracasei subsp. paracasei Lpp123]
MITDLKKVWRLVDSPLVSILWLLALGCAGIELSLAQVIQSVMQHAAFTVSMITLAAATALVIGLVRFVMAKLQTRGQYQLIQRIQTQLMAALMNGPIATDNQASGRRVNGFTTDAQTAAPLLMRSMTALVVGWFFLLAAGT